MSGHWQDIQQNTFTRWCNDYLSNRGIKVNDLKTDLKDGLALINLMEHISGKQLPRHNKHPRIISQKMENLNIALNFIKSEGIKLINIGADDLHEGNLRAILGLIWTLILRYEIKSGSGSDKDAMDDLLKWIRSKIPEYNIQNFTKDWNDGRAVCALTNAMRPGLIPNHREMDPTAAVSNCKHGIDIADAKLGIDKLVFPDEMAHPKVDRLAMMTYLAQFRNLKDTWGDAQRCHAHGPGLTEGIVGQPAPFIIEQPSDVKGKIEVKVFGPKSTAKVDVVDKKDGTYDVKYHPTEPGTYKVHVTLDGQHIQGSIFTVTVLEQESLGGEGKILCFYSTTSSSDKSKHDFRDLTSLFERKKVHLREDFVPWLAVDVMDKNDREAVFRKAGTRILPIVFVDDKYLGDYDKVQELEELGKLDELLKMEKAKLVSEEEHFLRLKTLPADSIEQKSQALSPRGPAMVSPRGNLAPPSRAPPSAPTTSTPAIPKFCPSCGTPTSGNKFCASCGTKLV